MHVKWSLQINTELWGMTWSAGSKMPWSWTMKIATGIQQWPLCCSHASCRWSHLTLRAVCRMNIISTWGFMFDYKTYTAEGGCVFIFFFWYSCYGRLLDQRTFTQEKNSVTSMKEYTQLTGRPGIWAKYGEPCLHSDCSFTGNGSEASPPAPTGVFWDLGGGRGRGVSWCGSHAIPPGTLSAQCFLTQ